MLVLITVIVGLVILVTMVVDRRIRLARRQHGGDLVRPAVPRLGEQAAAGRRDHRADRRLCARSAGRGPVGELATRGAALCLALRRHSGRRLDRRQPADRSGAAASRRARAGAIGWRLRPRCCGGPDDERRGALQRGLRGRRRRIPGLAEARRLEKTSPRGRHRRLSPGGRVDARRSCCWWIWSTAMAAAVPAPRRASAWRACWRRWPRSCARADIRSTSRSTPKAAGLPPLAAAVLADLREALVRLRGAAAGRRAAPAKRKPTAGGFFLPDAFTNPAHVQYALKTTAAAMFCYSRLLAARLARHPYLPDHLLHRLARHRGGNRGEADTAHPRLPRRRRGRHRRDRLPDARRHLDRRLCWRSSSPARFASAWVAAGTPRISYAGFQIAFAFFLCVIQGATPAFDMTIARDRVIGILFGNLVRLSGVHAGLAGQRARRIDPAIARCCCVWAR